MNFIKKSALVAMGVALALTAAIIAQDSTGITGSGVTGGGGNPKGNNFSIQYRNGTQFGGTGPGTSGQALLSNGAGSTPTFQSLSVAPTNATYITQTANASLSAEQALGALATGILKSTTTTGVVSIAASSDVISLWTGTCNNTTFLRADGACAAAGSGTVTSVGLTMPGIFSVTGTPVTTSGTLAVAASGTSGGIPYFSGATTLASSAALTANAVVLGGGAATTPTVVSGLGSSGQVLTSNGAGVAPTWQAASGGGQVIYAAFKTSDTTRTNNTVSADPALVVSGVPAGTYSIDVLIRYTTDTTPSYRGSITFDTTPSFTVRTESYRNSSGTSTLVGNLGFSCHSASGSATDLGTEATNVNFVSAKCLVVLPSTTTVTYQWAQVTTTGGTNTITTNGSYIRLTKLG